MGKSAYIKGNTAICSGCRTCMYACSLTHEGVADPQLSRIQIDVDVLDGLFCEIHTCAQCAQAACMQACKKEAISIDPATGAKVIDREKCVGCGLCVKACPFTPARVRVVKKARKAYKCDLCGGDPACVDACPMGALILKEMK